MMKLFCPTQREEYEEFFTEEELKPTLNPHGEGLGVRECPAYWDFLIFTSRRIVPLVVFFFFFITRKTKISNEQTNIQVDGLTDDAVKKAKVGWE